MRNQSDWLDIYKKNKNLQSDYQLAQHWQMHRSRISKYRRGRLKFELERVLVIADALRCEPLEIIVSIEFNRHQSELLKRHYFSALQKTIVLRMCGGKFGSWRRG